MAALPNDNPTLLDWAKTRDPDGTAANVIEALAERNTMLKDATAMEGNLPTGMRHSIRAGLPQVGWRRYNQGVDASKSEYIQVDDTCGMLEGRSVVDCKLAKLGGSAAEFRAREDKGFIQAMNNTVSTALFYASTKADPEKIHGLSARFDSLSGTDSADNVIDAGLSPSGADQHSIWFVTWHPETCHLIFPQGSDAGLEREDLGKEYESDKDGKKFLAWRTHFSWDLGLSVKDWRYIVRICNIDMSAITSTGVQLMDALIEAYNHIYDLETGRTVCYMNRTVKTWLEKQIANKSNVLFSSGEWHGKKATMFREIPIMTADALRTAEAVVT